MKSGIFFLFLFLAPVSNDLFAANVLPEPLIAKQLSPTVIKKKSPVEKLVMKWHKKQLRKKAALDQPKKIVNTLGYLSLAAGVLAPLLFVIAGLAYSYGFILFFGLFSLMLVPTAIKLGIISLRKRKKLEDKSGTSPVPAIIGLVLGSAFAILIFIALLTFSINYNL